MHEAKNANGFQLLKENKRGPATVTSERGRTVTCLAYRVQAKKESEDENTSLCSLFKYLLTLLFSIFPSFSSSLDTNKEVGSASLYQENKTKKEEHFPFISSFLFYYSKAEEDILNSKLQTVI